MFKNNVAKVKSFKLLLWKWCCGFDQLKFCLRCCVMKMFLIVSKIVFKNNVAKVRGFKLLLWKWCCGFAFCFGWLMLVLLMIEKIFYVMIF